MNQSYSAKEGQQKVTERRKPIQVNQKDISKNPVSLPNETNANFNRKTSKSKTFTDRFVPENDNKKGNDIFEKWGLTAEQVAEAEKFIIQIEEKVDECCPIRGSKKRKANE